MGEMEPFISNKNVVTIKKQRRTWQVVVTGEQDRTLPPVVTIKKQGQTWQVAVTGGQDRTLPPEALSACKTRPEEKVLKIFLVKNWKASRRCLERKQILSWSATASSSVQQVWLK